MDGDFMDKSVHYTPEAILASMREFYENILTNPKMATLKTQIITAFITGQVLGAQPAFALPEGQVTYTKFMDGISANEIERVRVAADGRTAEFLNTEG